MTRRAPPGLRQRKPRTQAKTRAHRTRDLAAGGGHALGVARMTSCPPRVFSCCCQVLMEAMGRNTRGKSTVEMDDIKFHQCVRLAVSTCVLSSAYSSVTPPRSRQQTGAFARAS